MASTTAASIFKSLKSIAPSIHFDVTYTRDLHFVWDGDGPDPRSEGFEAYDVDVSANVVLRGTLYSGSEMLGGVYDKHGRHDPDIGGYLPQMLEEAAVDLRKAHTLPAQIEKEANAAIKYLRKTMKSRYMRTSKRRVVVRR
jgi:hypothetical protein